MHDLIKVARAVATNQAARLFPSAYVKLTRQTGRGSRDSESAGDVAQYFKRCVQDYLDALDSAAEQVLGGRTVVEYGPGDLPGVALLLMSLGARKVYCVDRFAMMHVDAKNAAVLQLLIDEAQGEQRARMLACFKDPADLRAGFRPDKIEYLVTASGLSNLRAQADLVISRAVLEHVDNLEATFDDMLAAMRPGARAVHFVDLKSHGLHRSNPLDFLEWSPLLWNLMFSHKGVPNRWRADKYREIVQRLPVQLLRFEPTALAKESDVAQVRARLAEPFRGTSDADLRWMGILLAFEKARG